MFFYHQKGLSSPGVEPKFQTCFPDSWINRRDSIFWHIDICYAKKFYLSYKKLECKILLAIRLNFQGNAVKIFLNSTFDVRRISSPGLSQLPGKKVWLLGSTPEGAISSDMNKHTI